MNQIKFNRESENTPTLLGIGEQRSLLVDKIRTELMDKIYRVEKAEEGDKHGIATHVHLDSGELLEEFVEKFQPENAGEFVYVGYTVALMAVAVRDQVARTRKMGGLMELLGLGEVEERGTSNLEDLGI